jgi:hypothetical protein
MEKIGLSDHVWNRVRWFLALVALGLMIYIFWHLFRLLGKMFVEGGYFYIALMGLVGLLFWRVDCLREKYRTLGLYTTLLLMCACVCGALMYLSTLAFAVRVYPFIPVTRGGGDYTTELPSVLTFDPDFMSAIPNDLVDWASGSPQSMPVMILHDSTDLLFVTRVSEANGPEQWRRPGRENKPDVIYSIKCSAVITSTRVKSPHSAQE